MLLLACLRAHYLVHHADVFALHARLPGAARFDAETRAADGADVAADPAALVLDIGSWVACVSVVATDGKVYISIAARLTSRRVWLQNRRGCGMELVIAILRNRTSINKDDCYYLLIGEGGTETDHSAVNARGDSVLGPYRRYERNPLLTAKNTDEYF